MFQGDLCDLGLASLVQMLCLEGRRVMLSLQRHDEEGYISIVDGQVIDAAVYAFTGEIAFYEMATWPDGVFQVGPLDHEPARTVQCNTQFLLMESMRLADEARQSYTTLPQLTDKPLSKETLLHDDKLEDKLLRHLAIAERWMERLHSVRHHPGRLLAELAELVHYFAKLLSSIHGATGSSLAEAIEAVVGNHQVLRLLKINDGLLDLEATSALARSTDPKELTEALSAVISHHCMQLTGCFHHPEMAKEWTETYNVFLLDLLRALDLGRIPKK
jgi:hypothetical protein